MVVDEDEMLFDAKDQFFSTPIIRPLFFLLIFYVFKRDCLISSKFKIWVFVYRDQIEQEPTTYYVRTKVTL
jgi:hypothetical protein